MSQRKGGRKTWTGLLGLVVVFVILIATHSHGADQAPPPIPPATTDAPLDQAYRLAYRHLRSLHRVASQLEKLVKEPTPQPLSPAERTTLYHFDVWLDNASRQLRDHFNKWNTEYEHFTDTDKMRPDLARIFIDINDGFSQRQQAMRELFLRELDKFRFERSELRERSDRARRALSSLE